MANVTSNTFQKSSPARTQQRETLCADEAVEARRQLLLGLAATSFGEPLEIDVATSR